MRVIAGTAKGRKLVAPKGLNTRPTPARVREALFSIIAGDVPHARVLDLFAGTGALGIESLSRGADHAVFAERDRHVVTCLRRNLEPFKGRYEILAVTAAQALGVLGPRRGQFDLVFLDPPYAQNLWASTLADLSRRALLAEEGIIVCEHPSNSGPLEAPEAFKCVQTRAFGDVSLSIFAHA